MDSETLERIEELQAEVAALQAVLASTLAVILMNDPNKERNLAALEADLATKRVSGFSKPNSARHFSPMIGESITRIFLRVRSNLGLK